MSKETQQPIRDPQMEAILHDKEVDYRERVADGIGDAAFEALFARDNIAGLPPQKNQSFHAFDISGIAFNPAEDTDTKHLNFASTLRESVRKQAREATRRMSETDRQKYAMLYPQLIQALATDRRYINGIYEGDVQGIFQIAQDWFENPEMVDRTHFRQGVGGEEEVIGRAPAYMVAALETMERVKTVFTVHGNWGIHHELIEKLNDADTSVGKSWLQQRREVVGSKAKKKVLRTDDHEDEIDENGEIVSDFTYVDVANGEYVNDYIVEKIKETAGEKYYPDGQPYSNNEYLQEIQNPTVILEKDIRQVLIQAWTDIIGEEPNMEELKKEYHFTDKVPTLVVFNAANAAIQIDKMDPEKVMAARKATQDLQKAYITEFHPDLVDSVLVQDDEPWDIHDSQTRMRILYAYDLINSTNGIKTHAQQKLHQFGQHHARDNYGDVLGIPPAELYGVMHESFFADRSDVSNRTQRLIPGNIMTPLDEPRNTVYFQGPPERTFGVYRKIIAEKATSEDFSLWLRNQYAAIRFGYDDHAVAISQRAEQLLTAPVKKGKERDWRSCLAQAINDTLKIENWDIDYASNEVADKVTKTAQIGGAKQYFNRFINSDSFVSLRHPDGQEIPVDQRITMQQEQWNQMVSQLQLRKPTLDEIPATLDELYRLYRINDMHRTLLTKYKIASDEAYQNSDKEAMQQLAKKEEARFLEWPKYEAELSTVTGEVPTYYRLKNADVSVFPTLEQSSFAQYETVVTKAEKSMKQLKGTGSMIAGEIKQFAKNMDIDLTATDKVDTALVADATTAIIHLYETVDAMEHEQISHEEIVTYLRTTMATIAEEQHMRIIENMEENRRGIYVISAVALSAAGKKATEKVLQDANATVFKAKSVLYDYSLLIEDVRKGLSKKEKRIVSMEEAEEAYNAFLLDVFPQTDNTPPTDETIIFEHDAA